MEKKSVKFIYLGNDDKFIKRISYVLNDKYRDLCSFSFDSVSPSNLRSLKILVNNYDGILYDIEPENELTISKFIKKANDYYFPRKILNIGLYKSLDSDIITSMKRFPPMFSFRYSMIGTDEAEFISFAIVSFFCNKDITIENEYAIRTSNEDINLTVGMKVKSIALDEMILSSTANFNLKKFDCDNSQIKNLINFKKTDIHCVKVEKNSKIMEDSYDVSVSFGLVTQDDKEYIMRDIKDYLKLNNKNDKIDKNFLLQRYKSFEADVIKEKSRKFNNWCKTNYDIIEDTSFKNKVIIISKEFSDYCPVASLNIDNDFIFVQRLSKELVSFIKDSPPTHIIFDLEELGNVDCKADDVLFVNNYIKSLTYLKNTVGSEIFNQIKLSVFSNDYFNLNINGTLSHLGKFNSVPAKLGKETLDSFLTKSTNIFPTDKPLRSVRSVAYFDSLYRGNVIDVSIPAKIIKISEKEVFMTSLVNLPYLTPIKINHQLFDITFTLIPDKDSLRNNIREVKSYKGVVNCMDEQSRKRLRAYVIKNDESVRKLA